MRLDCELYGILENKPCWSGPCPRAVWREVIDIRELTRTLSSHMSKYTVEDTKQIALQTRSFNYLVVFLSGLICVCQSCQPEAIHHDRRSQFSLESPQDSLAQTLILFFIRFGRINVVQQYTLQCQADIAQPCSPNTLRIRCSFVDLEKSKFDDSRFFAENSKEFSTSSTLVENR